MPFCSRTLKYGNCKVILVIMIVLAGVGILQAQHKLMPLGNSITRGMGGATPYTGYRDDLYNLLKGDGWSVDFVGSLTDGNPAKFDANHEGHGGWKAQDIDANITGWMENSRPDIVLLHIGTNDISAEESLTSTKNEIESIINKIYAHNDITVILLCKLIPRKEQPLNEHIKTEQLNGLIEDLYEAKVQQGFNIYLVDQFSAFKQNTNWRTEYMIDDVHPSDAGYTVMAETFFDVLNEVAFPELILTVVINPTSGGRVTRNPDKAYYYYNELVTLRANPNSSYQFDHWSGDIDINSSNPRNIMMVRDRTIIANFVDESQEYVTTPTKPTGPTTAGTDDQLSFSTGGATSNYGHDVEYQYDWGNGQTSNWGSKNQNYTYQGGGVFQIKARARCVLHTNVISSWSNALSITVTGDASYILTVTANPTGSGTVQVTPQKATYTQDELVVIKAIAANSNYQFEYWSGDIDSNSTNPRNIYMVRSRTIIANFKSNVTGYTLSVAIDPANAGTVTKSPNKEIYTTGEEVTLTAQGGGGNPPVDKVFLEAENGSLSGNMHVGADTNASGGEYIYCTSSTPKSGRTTYSFNVLEAGTFNIWGRCYALSGNEDSFFMVVDNSTDTLTWHLQSSYYNWRWQKVTDMYDVKSFNLNAGSHTLSVISRDINTRLDKLILSKDSGFTPSGKMDDPSITGQTFYFQQWSGDLTSATNPTTITMNSNKNVIAHFIENSETVSTPNTPSGASSGNLGQNISFTTGGASSSLGNPVQYQFDFGAGTQSSWGGATRTNTFTQVGTFQVKARARSQTNPDILSDWSNGHPVTISNQETNTLNINIVPIGAGTVTRQPDKSNYELNESVTLTARAKVVDDNIRFEGENGTLSGSMTIGSDALAAGGYYVYSSSSVPRSGRIEYNFEISVTGTYSIWGRCYALSSSEDSFFILADNSSDTLTWHLSTEYNVWKWQKISHNNVVRTFSLNPGWHKLTVISRDINARLDNILITNDPSYIPSGKEETSSTVKFEAESGTIAGPFQIGNDVLASGAQYIYSTSAVPMSASAQYNFTIETSGVYYIWGRCYALSSTEDSYFFQVDNSATILTWHLSTEYNTWKWQKVSHNSVVQTFQLSKGAHTVKVISRDINSRIDNIYITNNPNYVPSGKEDAPISGDVAYRFDHWTGDVSGTINPINIQMSGSKTVTAYFVEDRETVTPPAEIIGPLTGIKGQLLSYTTSGAISSESNPVAYQFDWGDGITSAWGTGSRTHIFTAIGAKQIKTRARSQIDTTAVSEWSEARSVTISSVTLTLSIEPADGGTVTKIPTKTEYAYGDTINLNAVPATSYMFDHWSGDLTGSVNPAKIYMTANRTVTAIFSQTAETVSKPTDLIGPDSGFMGQIITFSTGGSVSNLGNLVEYQFDWGDGNLSAWGSATQTKIYNLSGIFQIKSRARSKINVGVISEWSNSHSINITGFSLTVVIDPQDKGIVTKNPNKSLYAYAEKAALTPIAIDGYKFDHWSGDLSGDNNPDTLVMLQNRQVIANFAQTQEIVTSPTFLTGPDSGLVEQNYNFSTGGSTSNLNNPVEYQYDWGDGTLSDWGNGNRSHFYNTVGVKQIKTRARSTADNSVVSNWTESHDFVLLDIYFTISVTIDPLGAGTVNKTPLKNSYRDGEIVILSPLPASGYVFDRWSGDLNSIDNPAYIIIHNSKIIAAHFKLISDVEKERIKIPEKFSLEQNYPNPFNPETTIEYQLAKECHVKITVFNVQGQKISVLVDEFQSSGYYRLNWNASDLSGNKLPSGIYLYRIETEYFTQINKMILMK